MTIRRFAATLSLLVFAPLPLFGELIWIEGEDADSSTMRGHGWYDSVKKPELSGGAWLSHFHAGEMPQAQYSFDASEAGEHAFWIRANPIGAAMSIRINGGAWQSVSFDKKEQNVNIASDGKPDLRFVAWINAGSLTLKQGPNSLEFRFESNNHRHE